MMNQQSMTSFAPGSHIQLRTSRSINPDQLVSRFSDDSKIFSDSQDKLKQDYEDLLIKTDEQEKELFSLGEMKNKLVRELQNKKILTDEIKQ